MKRESKFLEELEEKAREQGRLVETEMIPSWAKGLGGWLAVNPWRVIVPMAGIVYLVLRVGLGMGYRDWTLGLFGGFR